MDLCLINLHSFDGRKRVLDLAAQNLMKGNLLALKKMSNDILESACLLKSKEVVYLSYIPYMLYKVLTQPHIINSNHWNNSRKDLIHALNHLKGVHIEEYVRAVKNFEEHFRHSDYELYRYLKNILDKARIKQASKLYSMGYSLNKATDITDADIVELRSYINNLHDNTGAEFKDKIDSKVKLFEERSKTKNVVVFDSSALISITNNSLSEILLKLKQKLNLRFVIPRSVEDEVVKRTVPTDRFSWTSAISAKMILDGVIEVVDLDEKDLETYKAYERELNSIYKAGEINLEILQKGEIDCLILCKKLNACALAIDELITRMLIEVPYELKGLMQSRYKSDIGLKPTILSKYASVFQDIFVVRSAELMACASKNGAFAGFPDNILKSVLYSLKYGGCAISTDEIESYTK